ncbi:MAG: Mth938-like domain-containing protein [Alphaproteobacteria bacterium]
MAPLTPPAPRGRSLIQGYGDGGFRIGGLFHAGSVLVFADAVEAWPVPEPAGITLDSLAAVTAAGRAVDLLLVGCGRARAVLPESLRQYLRRAGIVAEAMDTGAACRTFNILLAEERRVAAALIAV